ncbi:MAG: shikimate kinase [Candidatus Methanofastidiosia archaeon]
MERNIALIGFMGTGKTTIGDLVAKRLGARFVDMDDIISKRYGATIASIFEKEGEPRFRDMENGLLRELAKCKGIVISCGGGIVVNEENIKILRESSTVILLVASVLAIVSRTKHSLERPLLNSEDKYGQVNELIKERSESYRRAAHHIIDTTDMDPNEVAERIIYLTEGDRK